MGKQKISQAKDSNGSLIIEGARIAGYLGSTDGKDLYVLELDEGTFHQTGPYTMTKESPREQ